MLVPYSSASRARAASWHQGLQAAPPPPDAAAAADAADAAAAAADGTVVVLRIAQHLREYALRGPFEAYGPVAWVHISDEDPRCAAIRYVDPASAAAAALALDGTELAGQRLDVTVAGARSAPPARVRTDRTLSFRSTGNVWQTAPAVAHVLLQK